MGFCILSLALTTSPSCEQTLKANPDSMATIVPKHNIPEVLALGMSTRDWYELLVKFAIFIGGIFLVIWQIGRQFKNSIALQRENEREKLKVQVYNSVRDAITEASNAALAAQSMMRSARMSLFISRLSLNAGVQNPTPPNQRAEHLIDANSTLGKKGTRLVTIIEEYQVIHPNLSVFIHAFGSALHDVRETFSPYFDEATKWLPIDTQENQAGQTVPQILVRPIPNEEQLENLQQLERAYDLAVSEFSACVHDFRIEAQNLLLGDLFEHLAPRREPIDQKHKVISTDKEDVDRLKRYFEEETAMGRSGKEAEERVRKNLELDGDEQCNV
jgi:hypothetical protein